MRPATAESERHGAAAGVVAQVRRVPAGALGLVGAGGIGIALTVAMDLFHDDEAATLILAIFALVVSVVRLSAALRKKIL
ncbi:MAG: hypothetical protein Q7U52_05585 [Hydrogenophaga sp.]|uniref:hypothetical protein n=1 Tax=Hydrogenophaga sp. TaxID=1904254 RepID=UPI002716A63A|nr:hypothetical protein [Hydrogenophaga sp.]MDO9147125.1 hypothetical protein [Hydrogenophaga sp.]MDO9605929.1 hypothetical protein [Hydrogenophaga sp.]